MPRITEPEARAAYLALGPDRSLARLHQQYTANAPDDAPAVDTLKLWSRKHGWQKLSAEHDERVTARVAQKVVTSQANDAFDAVTALTEAAEIALNAVSLRVAATQAAEKGDLRGILTAAVEALKLREVLTGGVSDRTQQDQSIAIEDRRAKAKAKVDEVFARLAPANAA